MVRNTDTEYARSANTDQANNATAAPVSNATYTQEYFDIIASLEGDISARRAAYAYMQNSTAICHHEVVASTFVPRLYNRKTHQTMKHIAETTHTILCKVINQYLNDPEYRTIFSFDERLADLILLPRGYDALLPFARIDIFLDENDYSVTFCEFNADGSSGMNENREISASIASSKTFQTFADAHHLGTCELFSAWIDEFLQIYESYEHRVEHPHIAICDFLENAVIDEFKVFAALFEERGIPCSICDVRDLHFDGETLTNADGQRIDAIWRRSVTNDIIEHWNESQNLIAALRAEKVALIGSFAGHLVHDKQIFSALFAPETKVFLTQEEIAFLEAHVPFTTFLDSAYIDLEKVRADKAAWIIKPTDHYGSDQVYAGRSCEQAHWDGLIEKLANQASGIPFLVQSYCVPFKTQTLPPDTHIEELRDEEVSSQGVAYNNLMGLYLYNGAFVGVFSRLGPLPTISKEMQGITAATIWVDCE
ncbi:MAG: carboxylate--amine ligase [Eggerthellaceae bacterium]|nr:carboxylate--amine ligase [Eggerthellaceae bacterium]